MKYPINIQILALVCTSFLALSGCGEVDDSGGTGSSKDAISERADESACPNDRCVAAKTAEFDAVVNWARSGDTCSSTVSWPTKIVKVTGSTFDVVCGDTRRVERYRVTTKNPNASNQAKDVVVTASNGVDTKALVREAPCKTDGCVFRKHNEFDSVIAFARADERCKSTPAWPQTIEKVNDSIFVLVCGDTTNQVAIVVRTEPTADLTGVVTKEIQ